MFKMELKVQSLENSRIDKYLSENTEMTRATIQRRIENEDILVNGKKVKASYKVQVGDLIEIAPEEIKESKLEAEDIPLDIVYEDKDILVVNKQKGLVVHPGNRKSRWNSSKCNFKSL